MLYNLKIYYYEKVHFCFFILSLFVYSCTDEPRNELSEKYGFSDEVLESREFNEYVTVFGEGLKLNTVARDNFIKKVEELNINDQLFYENRRFYSDILIIIKIL